MDQYVFNGRSNGCMWILTYRARRVDEGRATWSHTGGLPATWTVRR